MKLPQIHTAAALLAGALLCLAPNPTRALDDPCERRIRREAAPEDNSFRAKASHFAPRVAIRFWARSQGNRRRAAYVLPASVVAAPAPTPTARDADIAEPFGWEVGVRWNLVEMADAVDLTDTVAPEITPTECLRRIEMVDIDGDEE